MTLKQQIIFSSTFVALLAGVAGVMSYKNSMSIKGVYAKKVAMWNEELLLLEEMKTTVYGIEGVVEEALTFGSEQLAEREKDALNRLEQNTPRFEVLKTQLQSYAALGQRQEKAAASLTQTLALLQEIQQSYHPAALTSTSALQSFQRVKQENATLFASIRKAGFIECQEVGTNTSKKFTSILTWTLIACTLTFFFAIVFGQLIARDLSKAINNLKRWAKRMEEGNYASSRPTQRTDEFGNLEVTFRHLTEDLQKSRVIENQNAELETLNNELKKKNDSLDSFIYRVSHDLKAPVVNLQSLLKVVLDQTQNSDSEILHKTLFYMGATSEKLEQTIIDLLEVSRIERSLKVEREMIDIKEILEEVILENSEALERTETILGHQLEVASQVYFSRPNIKSLLSNLITNSIKYRSPNRRPEIQLATEISESYVCLSIKDNGIGIDLERHRDKLFGMFNRFHDHVEGSGVGLYIVKKLIEESNGKLEIESEVNVGTTIRLFFIREEVEEKVLLEASPL